MKIPSHYKLAGDHPTHYMIHDARDGKTFPVAKSALAPEMHAKIAKIQKFDDGGTVQLSSDPNSVQVNPALLNPNPGSNATLAQGNPTVSIYSPPDSYGVDPEEDAKQFSQSQAQTDSTPTAQAAPVMTPRDPASVVPDPIAAQTNAANSALQSEKDAVLAGSGAEGQQNQDTAQAYKDYAAKLDKVLTPQQVIANHQQADQDLMKAYMNKEIDPDRYWKNQGTGSKISAALGMIFSGVGSARTGQPNYAVEAINNAVNRDIQAQRDDQSKSMNLWKMNREATQDDMQANLATQNQLLNAVKAKALQYEAQYAGPIARAKVAPMVAQIDQQMAQNNMHRALLSGAGSGQVDPAQLVPMLVPPEKQQKAFDEIGAAQETAKNAPQIMRAFDNAANNVHVVDAIPGMPNADQKALHALLGPTFRDVEGSVRQAAMDNLFGSITPQVGDDSNTKATKRAALQGYLQSKLVAPTAKGFGIDLKRYASTTPQTSAQQYATMSGVKYAKVQGGWRRIQ